MLLWFCMGAAVGAGVGWFAWWTARRDVLRLDEQRQMLAQEKLIVFDFVHNMVEAIGEGVTRQELFERVVHAAILSTGGLSACIFERKGKQLRGMAVEGLFPPHRPLPESSRVKVTTRAKFIEQVLKSEVFEVGEGLVGKAAQTGEGVLIENALRDPRVIHHDDPSLEVRSVIVVPIQFRDRNIGVLAIVNPSDGGSFGETDFSLSASLAEQAGLAIHNLDLMSSQIEKNKLDTDLSLAREIQNMLLPTSVPQVPELQLATVYRPAQKVGGDLYDVFSLGENKVGVAIADVSGKGIPASLIMAICQSNLRHFARNHNSPSDVLQKMNSVMVEEMRPDMFITMIYAVIDMERKELVLARGGHELPILVHSSGGENGQVTSELLRSDGMALGMVPGDIFDESMGDRTIPFRKGDVLVVYTDGVTEAVNADGVEFSNGRLADAVRSLRARPAEEMVEGIMDRVSRFTGPVGQADDFTVLAIKHM